MKKGVLIFSLAACFTGMALSSYEHGPAYEGGINRTGSQGGAANCAGGGCHAANTPTTIVAVLVTTTAGVPVTSYTPGTTYSVTITGHNTESGVTLSEFGFQVSAVLGGLTQAGTFAVPSGANLRVTSLTGLQIVEHKQVLADSVTDYSVAHFSWTAPAAGSGPVKFYGILNALGGGGSGSGSSGGRLSSGGGTGGEYPNPAPVVTLSETGGTSNPSAVNDVEAAGGITLFPNPCNAELNIATTTTGTYSVRVYAANGTMVYTSSINATATSTNTISTANMPAGIYYVEMANDANRVVKTIVKR